MKSIIVIILFILSISGAYAAYKSSEIHRVFTFSDYSIKVIREQYEIQLTTYSHEIIKIEEISHFEYRIIFASDLRGVQIEELIIQVPAFFSRRFKSFKDYFEFEKVLLISVNEGMVLNNTNGILTIVLGPSDIKRIKEENVEFFEKYYRTKLVFMDVIEKFWEGIFLTRCVLFKSGLELDDEDISLENHGEYQNCRKRLDIYQTVFAETISDDLVEKFDVGNSRKAFGGPYGQKASSVAAALKNLLN